MRKILLGLLFIVLLVGGGYVVYVKYFQRPAVSLIATGETQLPAALLIEPTPVESGELPPALTAITNEPVVDYWINSFDGQLYYLTVEGLIRRIDPATGVGQTITSSNFEGGIRSVVASLRGDSIIIESGIAPQAHFKVFDMEREIWRVLPSGTTAAAWSPSTQSNEIAFLRTLAGKTPQDPPTSSLNIYNVSKGSSRLVTSLNHAGLRLTWINQTTLLLTEPPSGLANTVWSYDLQKQTLKTFIPSAKGLWVNWLLGPSPAVSGGIGFNNEQGSYLITDQGGIQALLPINTTPTKCAFERPLVYCAVMESGVTKNQLPEGYLQKNSMSRDSIVSFSLSDLPKIAPTPVSESLLKTSSVDIWHLSKRQNTLYFVNRWDQRVYSLGIEQ